MVVVAVIVYSVKVLTGMCQKGQLLSLLNLTGLKLLIWLMKMPMLFTIQT